MTDKLERRRIPYFGDFVLFSEVGRGGMGVVYEAQQSSLDRRVALKVLHSNLAASGAAIQRLRLEAEAAARLDHPNIVPIFEIGEHEGHPYLAMQFVEGENLAERIGRIGSNLMESDSASLMAKIARAVHHAHQRGVLHRDLKPGNILIDENGEPHLIDFGLAKCLEDDSGVTQTGAFLGTPAYASPEQAAGQNKHVTTASDVYSLGAIFYALLTGHAPFLAASTAETIDKVKNNIPPSPRSVRPTLSVNLETICLKCLEKEPARRYSSALELAEELERFLEGKPITARPVSSAERLWMWTRRNPLPAALWVMGLGLVVVIATGLVFWRDARTTMEAEARNHRQRQLIEKIQAVRLTSRSAAWSERAWALVTEAAKIPTAVKANDVRNQAAALLAGLDAHRLTNFTNFGASSVLFDPAGRLLLMGGLGDGAKLWDTRAEVLHTASETGLGPVAFLANGQALQLVYDADRHSLTLTDIASPRTVQEWMIPSSLGSQPLMRQRPTLAALAPGGTCALAVFKCTNGQDVAVALASNEIRLLASFSNPVTAVTVSPDGVLAVVAESSGTVRVWSIPTGGLLTQLMASLSKVNALALKQIHRIPRTGLAGTEASWLLAAGDAGGTVTIWDLHTQTVSAYCRGGHHQIYALAFSPDGMTLASGGRGPVKLWDVATGQLLLDVGTGDYITGLCFSPDGMRLAVSTSGANYPARVSIWRLEFGRGIETLRGLSGEISKICFSADGRTLAALAHNWEVGVWDLAAGHLMRVFDVPRGEFADNAALALSPDGKRLAFSGSTSAKIYDIQSGSRLAACALPPGLVDVLGFPDDEHLMLFRMETLSNFGPFSDPSPREHPPVCRIRDLLGPDPRKPVAEIRDFNGRVFTAVAPLDGRHFVVEGLHVQGAERMRMIKCFDALTGQKLWTLPSTNKGKWGTLVCDATGRLLTFHRDQSLKPVLVDLQSGASVDVLALPPTAIRAQPRLYAVDASSFGGTLGMSLFSRTSEPPLVTLGIDTPASTIVRFDGTGSRLAWGNTDGTVIVCNLQEIHRQFLLLGLSWDQQ